MENTGQKTNWKQTIDKNPTQK